MKFHDMEIQELNRLVDEENWSQLGHLTAMISFDPTISDEQYELFLRILAHERAEYHVHEAVIDVLFDIFEEHADDPRLISLLCRHAVEISPHDSDNCWKNKKAIDIVLRHRDRFPRDCRLAIANHPDEMIQEKLEGKEPLVRAEE